MNEIDIARGLVFKALGIGIDSFDHRLMSQKKIYLLQQAGLNLGYFFNWYVYGPYSPGLTNYLYGNIDILKNLDFGGYKLSESARTSISKVEHFASSVPDGLRIEKWYELLASVLYIKNDFKEVDRSHVFTRLISLKPQFNNEIYFDQAWCQLSEMGLLQGLA